MSMTYLQFQDQLQEFLEECEYVKHPFLTKSGFKDIDSYHYQNKRVFMYQDSLIIPIRNFPNYHEPDSLIGFQRIDPKGKLSFIPKNLVVKGSVYLLGDNLRIQYDQLNAPLHPKYVIQDLEKYNLHWYVKDYWTGLSVREALDKLGRRQDIVIVCFDYKNMAYLNQLYETQDYSRIMVCDRYYFDCRECGKQWFDVEQDRLLPRYFVNSILIAENKNDPWHSDEAITCPFCNNLLSILSPWLIPIFNRSSLVLWWLPPDIGDAYDYHMKYGIAKLMQTLDFRQTNAR